MWRRLSRGVCLTAALAVATLILGAIAPAAPAATPADFVTCAKAPGEAALTVDGNPYVWDRGEPTLVSPNIRVVRVGDEVQVWRWQGIQIICGGDATPTVDEITRIEIRPGFDSSLEIDLSGGPFAPGADPESGDDEIEITSNGTGQKGSLGIVGTAGPDSIVIGGLASGQNGAKLNGDDDIDFTFAKLPFFGVRGDGGSDLITADGNSSFFAGPVTVAWPSLDGGEGNDTLATVNSGSADGEAGDDLVYDQDDHFTRLSGGSGTDTLSYAKATGPIAVSLQKANDTPSDFENLIGGPFADKLTGSSLPNVIDARDGRQADAVSCGDPASPPDRAIGETNVDIVYDDCEQIEWLNLPPVFPDDGGSDSGQPDGPTHGLRERERERARRVRVLVLGVQVPDTAQGLIDRGARAKVRCSSTCIATVDLVVRGNAAELLPAGPVIARTRAIVGAGTARWIRLRPDPGVARVLADLPGAGRPSVMVRATARAF